MAAFDDADDGLTWVGAPMEVVRVIALTYLDDARHRFEQYVADTLAASQRAGGRFNPPCEFGALYTTTDSETAWEEIAARYRREGIVGLPAEMGLIGIVIREGRYVDLTDTHACELWDVEQWQLTSVGDDAHASCQEVARAIRVRADFIQAPSARASGTNVALFPDRADSTLGIVLQSAERQEVPEHLRQRPREEW